MLIITKTHMTYYRYTDGETVQADETTLEQLLKSNREFLQNYLDIADDLEDPSFIARGNGFCDTKYSEDFIDKQINKYRQRIADIEKWIKLKQR